MRAARCVLLFVGTVGARRTRVVEHTKLFAQNGSFLIDTAVDAPRFDPGDNALDYLQREGYVVLRGVANASELSRARELFWAFVEGARVGAVREDPSSWRRLQPNQYGIVWGHGSGQSRLMWHVRTLPRLREMFERVWDSADLIASFEGFSIFPPLDEEENWDIADGGWCARTRAAAAAGAQIAHARRRFHTDQNGVSRPGLQTIQSLTALWDQDESTGAFVVVPRSHKRHAGVTKRVYQARPRTPADQQFLMLPENDLILLGKRRPRLVRCRAGDAILWDSRTVHCNTPALLGAPPLGPEQSDPPGSARPNRLSAYVAMAPRHRATPDVLRQRQVRPPALARPVRPAPDPPDPPIRPSLIHPHPLRPNAQRAFLSGTTCTHWPFEATCLDPPASRGETASDPLSASSADHWQLIGHSDPVAATRAHAEFRATHSHRHADAAHERQAHADLANARRRAHRARIDASSQPRDAGAAPSSDGETPAEQVDGDAKCAEKDPRTAAGFLDEQTREYGNGPRHVSQRAYASEADAGELRL